MKVDSKCKLLVHPEENEFGSYQNIIAEEAKWKYLNFGAIKLRKDQTWVHNTADSEMCLVLLSGKFLVSSKWGNWETKNSRGDVFSGLPHAVYFPPETDIKLTALSEKVDFAFGYTKGEKRFKGFFVTPEMVNDYGIELRGGDNASRQINSILPPGSECSKLVCVEVYTPSGNWSSFPAHKHDERKVDSSDELKEAKLEEIYFYKFDKPQGFALQKIYTDDLSLNKIVEPNNNDAVLIPKGYHPVCAGHGYNTYYLNFLAGSDQSLANTSDPNHKWIYQTWKKIDHRLPLVTLEMNNGKGFNEKI